MTPETLNMVVGLMGGLLVGSIAVAGAAAAAWLVSVVAVEIRNMWKDER